MSLEIFQLLAQAAAETGLTDEESVGFFGKIGEWFSSFFGGICDWFKGLWTRICNGFKDVGRWAIIVCVIVLMVAGFAGTIVPFLPGTTLILAGSCLHFFALGMTESELHWGSLVVIGVLYIASVIVDNFSGAIGAKWFGSSKWGIVGAILGGLIGLFWGLPGIIIGPILGVFIFELIFGKKRIKEASSSTVGTLVGSGAGLIAGIAIGVLMIVCYLLDIFIWK